MSLWKKVKRVVAVYRLAEEELYRRVLNEIESGVRRDGLWAKALTDAHGHKEDKSGWSGFLKHLKDRGLKGVRLIVSDACMGLVESAAEYFPQAQWQRCTVHFYRNVFSVVPSKHLRTVSDMLKAIHACEDREAALDRSRAVTKKLRAMRLKEAAARIEEGIKETLTFYSFPAPHRRRIRTNNPLERIMREIRRRTRVVGAFPDGQSALMLAAAWLRHIAGTQWGTKRYLRMDLLRDLDASETHVA